MSRVRKKLLLVPIAAAMKQLAPHLLDITKPRLRSIVIDASLMLDKLSLVIDRM